MHAGNGFHTHKILSMAVFLLHEQWTEAAVLLPFVCSLEAAYNIYYVLD